VTEQPFRFELRQLTEYTPASIADELRRVAALVPEEEPLTIERFSHHARVDHNTVKRRFGTWENALRAAGLAHRFSGREGVRAPLRSRMISDDAILESLRELALRLGKGVLTLADIEEHTDVGQKTLVRRWGSVQKAIKAAGLETSKVGSRYSDEECHQNLFNVWTHYGRAPQHREMSVAPSIIGPKAYVRRFGSWRKALALFVEWVEASSAESDDRQSRTAADTEPTSAPSVEPRRGPRDISWGLRFKVMHRDRFKCVLCGDHPATNLNCKLHVDHIVPWSKGGATAIQNLRTLCEVCNVGRSNRYDE
jgi:hypothetical protein